MVFIGERRFRHSHAGPEPREFARFLVPALLLGGVVIFIVFGQEWGNRGAPTAHRVSPGGTPAPDTSDEQPVGERIPPPPGPEPAARFVARETVLDQVADGVLGPDGAILNEDTAEEHAAIDYLFHRWRAGVEVPLEGPRPDYLTGFPRESAQLRGERFQFDLQFKEEPQFRVLPAGDAEVNPSGVSAYWEVMTQDDEERIHRLLFLDNPVYRGAGSWVRVTADYLRLHLYRDSNHVACLVPQWVALDLDELPPEPGLDWEPVTWVGVLSLFGLLIVWFAVITHGKPRRSRTGGSS